MKKHYLTTVLILMISTFLISCAGQQVKTGTSSFMPYEFQANQYVPKVDNFMVILDNSSSMGEKYNGQPKTDIAKNFLNAMNKTLPEMKYNGALRVFGKTSVSNKSTLLVYGLEEYSTGGFGKALKGVTGPDGNSPLGKAITAASGDLKSAQGKIAVIVVSDGKDMGQAPVTAAKAMKNQFGDRVCIDTILVGNDPGGKAVLEQVAAAGDCGFATNTDRLASSSKMAGFVEGIFLAKAPPKPAPKPAPAPVVKPSDSDGDGVPDNLDQCPNTPKGATVDSRGCWAYSAVVMFDFDSSKIKPEAYPMLDEGISILQKNPEMKVEVDGHTDNVGSAAYNMKLSERRAKAVKDYAVNKGIDSKRISVKGFGLTKPATSNDTEEGRAQNRRVELTPIR